jgi:predicted acylesterase/phospholipase RssA
MPEIEGGHLVLWAEGPSEHVPRGWRDVVRPRTSHRFAGAGSLRCVVDEVARRVCGRSTGVVLSGGGARAFAQIAALEEITSAGVVIDRVGGTSMGALIGAMFAAGMTPEQIDARCYHDWVRHNPLSDYTLPRRGLIRGEKVRALLRRNFGDLAIEDLDREYFCVSCDLQSGELVTHRSGSVADALAASMCVPGLSAPVELDGRQLVDGGMRNNLPVDVMAAGERGPIIAIDTTAQRQSRGAPSLPEMLSRLVLLASEDTRVLAERHCDLVIAPRCDDVGMLEFHQIDRMRDAGRRAAREALAHSQHLSPPGRQIPSEKAHDPVIVA